MVFSYAGSGSISPVVGFDFGNISYSYTPSSILPFIYVDLGTLGAPTATIDHGSVTEPTAGQEDWGDLRYDQQTRFPFGVVRLASSTTFVVKKVFVGSGQLFELGEAFTRLQAPWIVEGTISLRGEANAAFLYRYDASGIQYVYGGAAASYSTQYEGSGSLFSASFAGEAKVTVYPEDIKPTTISNITLDAADLSSGYNATYDGTAFQASSGSGSGSGGGFAVGPHVRFGAGPSAGTSSSSNRIVEYDLDLTGVEEITFKLVMGNGSNGGETPDNGEDLWMRFLDTGLPLNDASRKLLDNAETTYTTPGEKTVTVPVEARRDNQRIRIYQLTWSGTTQYDHYGFIELSYEGAAGATGDGDTRKTLFEVSGDALVLSSLRHIGSGTLFNIGNTQPLRTFAYDGSGTLFGFGNETRSLTYAYPGTDLFTYEDYGQIAATTTQPNEDFGSLFRDPGDDVYEIFDRGEILVNYTKYPYGLFKLRSDTLVNFLPNYRGSGTIKVQGAVFIFVPPIWEGEGTITLDGESSSSVVVKESGFGRISTLSGAAETFTASPDEEDKLLNFRGVAGQSVSATPVVEGLDVKTSGDAFIRFIPKYAGFAHLDIDGKLLEEKVTFAHLGTGRLFDFIGADERRVYNYTSSSIDFITHPSYGFITDAATTFEDYGDLDLRYTGETGWMSTPDIRVDYHGILDNYTNYPFGTFPIQGEAHASRSFEYIASGPLFVFTGEVTLRFPPFHAGNVDVAIHGEVVERRSKSYIGLQSLQISGAGSEAYVPNWNGSGTIFASGEPRVRFSLLHIGDGKLFDITGASTEVRTRGYHGSGSIFSNGILSESVTKTFPVVPEYSFNLNLTATNIYNRVGTSWTGPSHSGHPQYGSTGENTVAWYPNGGSGTCQFGGPACIDGFDVGPHFRIGSGFGEETSPREIKILLDLTDVEEITLSIIRGNGSNGGAAVDGSDHLRYRIDIPALGHTGGSNILVNATDTSFDSLKDVTISLYPGEKVNNAVLVLEQPVYASSMISSWGFTGLNYVVNSAAGGDVRKTLFDVTGVAEFSRSQVHEGSGTLFNLSGASESKTSVEIFDTLFNVSGEADVLISIRYHGSGSIFSNGILSESVTKTFPLTPGYTANLTLTATDLNNQTLTNVTPAVEYVTGGSGTGSSGGFDIGPHFKFGVLGTGASFAADGRREVEFTLDLRQVEELTFNIIKGNNANGGERPECFNASTGSGDNLDYSINLTSGSYLASACDTSLENLSAVTVTVPAAHRVANARVAVYQGHHSGSTFDVWGFQSLQYTINRSGDQRKDLFDITGDTTFSRTRLHEGFGSLFSLSGASESKTSDEVFTTLFNINGASSEVRTRGYEGSVHTEIFSTDVIEKATFDYVGSGVVSTLSGGAESFTVNPDERQVLLDFRGTSAEKFVANPPDITTNASISGEGAFRFIPIYIGAGVISVDAEHVERVSLAHYGSGDLFTFSSTRENVVYSYNNSSIDYFIPIDFGSVSLSASTPAEPVALYTETDFGTLDLRYTGETGWMSTPDDRQDWQYILENYNRYPFGLFERFSGAAADAYTRIYTGSGNLYRLRGSGTLTLPNVHSSSGGFEIFGAATSERIGVAESFNVLFEASGSASVLITNAEQPDVEIELDGKAGVSFTGNTVQDATIFITGASTEVRSRGYEGTGFISTLSGAVEAFTASPDDSFSLFDVTGQSVFRTTQAHEGFGTVFNLSGASITNFSLLAIGGGDTTISGEAVVVATRRYKGTGVISTLSGSAQTFTASPDNLFSLFDFTGQSVFRTTQAHQGFGTLFGFSGASESATFREVFNTLLIITGEGESSFTPNFNGSGFISTLSGAAEAFAASPDDLFSLFDLTGSVSDSTTKSFVGSGSLFDFSGSTEAFTRNAVEREALFTISGAAQTRLNPKYIGQGHLDIDGGLVTEKVTLAHHVTGSLFKFIGADERRVYSYNNSSIDFLVPIDLGSVAAVPSTSAEPVALYIETDFGALDLVYTGEKGWFSTPDDRQDWQHILENYSRYPFGLFERFSGTAVPIIKLSHIGSGTTKLFGEGESSFTPNFNGSGFISTLSGAAESFTINPEERQVLFDVTGQGRIKATLSHRGFGNLFGLSGAAESRAVDEVFTTLLNVNGEAKIVSARRYTGTGFISTLSGAAESFTVNPRERELLFSVSGLVSQSFSFGNYKAEGTITVSGQLAKTENLTFAEQPEVQARISGAGTESYVPNYNGSGRITTLFGVAESRTINTRAPGALFDVTGFATQAFSFGNYEGETTARIFREDPLTESRTFVATGFGRFAIFGDGEYARTQEYIGLGQIFSKGIGGESVTRRIPAFQADLALSGFAGKAVTFNPPDITTHLHITGDATAVAAFVESFTVRLTTDGTARERFVPNHIGDGAIASRGIGGEAISRRLPAFQADMFVSGFAGQKTTVREQFFGSLFTFSGSSAPELLAFAEQPEVQVEVSGESKVRFSLLHIGEGRISTLSGAAESATFNPRERELLFSFGGGVSDIKITKAETKQIEVSVTGEATDIRFIPNWIVEGTIPVSGIAHTTRSVVHTGEGFISTLSGAAESFTYNPTEDTALFTFLGTASIRSAVSEVKTVNASIFNEEVTVYLIRSFIGSGDITVLGQTDDSTARVYEGTGVISTLSGSAESFTVNPDDITTLFGILGIADTRPIQVFTKIGSGTLFSSFTAGEARVISVPVNVPSQESKGLFKLEGSSPESFTIPYEGSGTLFSFEGLEERRTFAHQTEGTVTLSGIASTPRTRDHIGSGSLFSFIEAASAVRFITSTRTVLFDITGESVFRTTQAHEGTGSLFTTFTAGESRTYKLPEHLVPNIVFKGAARIKNTFLYQGQTNLQVSGSAQESFTPRVYEGDVRLKTSGESVQKFVTAETSQGGTVKLRGAATFLITNAFQTDTLFDLVGVAKVNLSPAFAGSGTIFTFVSTTEIGPDAEFEGSGTITLRGESIDKKVNVAPERTYGWII